MENQHKKISGYRDLTQAEIDLMNKIKAKAEEVGILVEQLNAAHSREGFDITTTNVGDSLLMKLDNINEAKRWAATGKTHLQLGFMALIRSVARPTTF